MKDRSNARDITDIICLTEGVPASRTPLNQLVTTKACNFKRFSLLRAPSGKLVGANLFDLCTLQKHTKGLKSSQ